MGADLTLSVNIFFENHKQNVDFQIEKYNIIDITKIAIINISFKLINCLVIWKKKTE